jgi:hypothetical protein
MRCTYTNVPRDVNFDRIRYQQFLREQGLSERDIKRLNIHFINDFTLSHFKGSEELLADGAFFQRGREYVEEQNKTARAFYRPVNPDNMYAAIFLRPEKCPTLYFLHHTLLHETRHHIQHCQNLSCCRTSPGNEGLASLEWKDRPSEKDAEKFADDHVNQVSFFLSVPRPWKRSDLPPPLKRSDLQ